MSKVNLSKICAENIYTVEFWEQVQDDYFIGTKMTFVTGICYHSDLFKTHWNKDILRINIQYLGREFIQETQCDFLVGYFMLFYKKILVDKYEGIRVRKEFLNWVINKLKKGELKESNSDISEK